MYIRTISVRRLDNQNEQWKWQIDENVLWNDESSWFKVASICCKELIVAAEVENLIINYQP